MNQVDSLSPFDRVGLIASVVNLEKSRWLTKIKWAQSFLRPDPIPLGRWCILGEKLPLFLLPKKCWSRIFGGPWCDRWRQDWAEIFAPKWVHLPQRKCQNLGSHYVNQPYWLNCTKTAAILIGPDAIKDIVTPSFIFLGHDKGRLCHWRGPWTWLSNEWTPA